MGMMFCKECIAWVLSTHIDEKRLEWVEWNKIITEQQNTIKGYVGVLLQYDDFVSPHNPIKVPPQQKSIFDTLVKLNKKVDEALQLQLTTMQSYVWSYPPVTYETTWEDNDKGYEVS